jgi:hypothetical protein
VTQSQHDHSAKAFNHDWLTEPAVLAVYVNRMGNEVIASKPLLNRLLPFASACMALFYLHLPLGPSKDELISFGLCTITPPASGE